ncbi:ATP-dependent DNA helicase RecG [Aeromicrobium sp. Root495]|uniref:ATP-dependent DNA helicase RecG n=1 Tax=Aeromicrobium sp. Root495 TaxID=1736550 RepID=UPI0007020ED3|nr:ATP-dependent DNA helicase RecG [Aeromicrobium sp. Root495]KQY58854.1 ATP-dependent DNA helicase RecG [Aeromicrobium sp. Root495]
MVDLDTRLRGVVGDKTATSLSKAFGHETVGDLLRHFPRRYAELGKLTDLKELQPGQHVTVMARVVSARTATFGYQGRRPKTRTEVIVTDGTGQLSLTFFQQQWLEKKLSPGTLGLFAGVVGEFRGTLQLTHPDHEVLEDDDPLGTDSRIARGIIPMYPASAKVPTWRVEKCIEVVLDVLDDDLPDPLPEEVRKDRGLMGARDAFVLIHRPLNAGSWQSARDRFRFEEAFVLQTVFAQRRHDVEQHSAVARPPVADGLRERFLDRLPFTLTAGQQEVSEELATSLSGTVPMHRLLQGEVGSGKTIVALLAMLQVVDAGAQAALLAPTEVLAAQHHRSITMLLGDLAAGGMLGGAEGATRVRLLTGSMGAKARQETLLDAQSGAAGIVIGTHALIQDSVGFAELGLVVIDEQHRFGVEQRAALVDRAEVRPHTLVMTATPIPRTVAMTVFGDLETSTLRELPAGRQPIQTTVVPALERPAWMQRGWERVREEVGKGRQAYVVVSRIGTADEAKSEDAESPTRSLVDVHAELERGPLAGLRLAMLHGRMAADEKDTVMSAFAAGEIDVLVATTVVEVGVDVPNATVMVVIDADRFGVSQLHQLRGRVGRGSEAGLCLLVTGADAESPARERLDAVASTTDGFELSRLDIELRREGDVLGASQSGSRSGLRLLSVVKHEEVIVAAREAAQAVVAQDPALSSHPDLLAAVRELEETESATYMERT